MAHAKTLSDTNFRTLIALLEKESRDLARDRAMVLLSMKAGLVPLKSLTSLGAASVKTTPSSNSSRRRAVSRGRSRSIRICGSLCKRTAANAAHR